MRNIILLCLLSASAAAPALAVDKPEAAADKQDKIICKRFSDIGSLIESHKECKTKRQWENERANLTMRDGLGTCSGQGGQIAANNGSFCGDGH